jgi:hypothetical protein
VGVGTGVFCEEAEAREGCFAVGTSPEKTVPSSLAENVKVEQNPSEEVINNVNPSFALPNISPMHANGYQILTKSNQ